MEDNPHRAAATYVLHLNILIYTLIWHTFAIWTHAAGNFYKFAAAFPSLSWRIGRCFAIYRIDLRCRSPTVNDAPTLHKTK